MPTFNKLAKLGDLIVSYLKLSITDSLSYPLTGVTAIASKKVKPIVYPNSHPKGRKSNPQQPFSLYGIHGTAPIHPSIHPSLLLFGNGEESEEESSSAESENDSEKEDVSSRDSAPETIAARRSGTFEEGATGYR